LKCSRLSVVKTATFTSPKPLKDAVVSDLENLLEESAVNLIGDAGRSWVPARGEGRRAVSGVKAGIIEDRNAAGLQAGRAGFPITFHHLVIVVAIDVNHVPRL